VLPLSVLLLARDEADRLARLLPELDFARDVVVVVDAATRDRTREVAAAHGARVAERALEDFGAQRAFGLQQCHEPWVLWLDADERLDPRARAAVANAVGAAGGPSGYRIERRTWFFGRRIRFCGWGGERVLRLFRREAASFAPTPVHEQVEVSGPLADLAGAIEHRSYETWADCRDKLVRYASAGAEKARRAGRRAGPLDVALRPPLRFARMYLAQAGFLDGARGLAVCALGATQVFLKYLELWLDPTGRAR
jgi:glycosyltransferase involved in cell wall biosynthesis